MYRLSCLPAVELSNGGHLGRKGHNAEPALGLKGIDDGLQRVGRGAGAELLQGFWFHFWVADVDDDVEACPKMIGTLHNHVKCDTLGGHMTLGGYLAWPQSRSTRTSTQSLSFSEILLDEWP